VGGIIPERWAASPGIGIPDTSIDRAASAQAG
jgi:hypothetical protein